MENLTTIGDIKVSKLSKNVIESAILLESNGCNGSGYGWLNFEDHIDGEIVEIKKGFVTLKYRYSTYGDFVISIQESEIVKIYEDYFGSSFHTSPHVMVKNPFKGKFTTHKVDGVIKGGAFCDEVYTFNEVITEKEFYELIKLSTSLEVVAYNSLLIINGKHFSTGNAYSYIKAMEIAVPKKVVSFDCRATTGFGNYQFSGQNKHCDFAKRLAIHMH